MTEFIYCLTHEKMVKLEQGFCVGHAYEVQTEHGTEIEMCCLEEGFAYCPPPPPLFSDHLDYLLSEDWRNWVEDNQPDYDEQLVSDLQAAVSLLSDLEGERK